MRSCCLFTILQEIKIDDVFRAWNARSNQCVSYLDVRNKVAIRRLKFRGYKVNNTVTLKDDYNMMIIYLEVSQHVN